MRPTESIGHMPRKSGSPHSVRGTNGGASPFPFVIYNDNYAFDEYITAVGNSGFAGVLVGNVRIEQQEAQGVQVAEPGVPETSPGGQGVHWPPAIEKKPLWHGHSSQPLPLPSVTLCPAASAN